MGKLLNVFAGVALIVAAAFLGFISEFRLYDIGHAQMGLGCGGPTPECAALAAESQFWYGLCGAAVLMLIVGVVLLALPGRPPRREAWEEPLPPA